MRRIATTTESLFMANFSLAERRSLIPDHGGQIFSEALGWASWAQWGQRALLALAACAGERGKADLKLRVRGAQVAASALACVVPELRCEFGPGFSF